MRHVHTLTQEYCCQHWVLSTQGGLSMSAICWNIGESPCTDVLHIIRTPWQCMLDTFNSTCLAFMCVHSYARMSACVGGWLCRMCIYACVCVHLSVQCQDSSSEGPLLQKWSKVLIWVAWWWSSLEAMVDLALRRPLLLQEPEHMSYWPAEMQWRQKQQCRESSRSTYVCT